MCRLSWNLGASTSWNPQGLSRPVIGLLYLYLVKFLQHVFQLLSVFPCRRGKYNHIISYRRASGWPLYRPKHVAQVYSQNTANKTRHFSNLFISVRRCTCFRRFFCPSSGAQNCTYSARLLARLEAGSSNGLTNTWRRMCSFELLMMDGKTVWDM